MQAELDDPGLVASDQTPNLAKRGVAPLQVGEIEIRIVDEVQHLTAKLQAMPFPDQEILENGEIHDDGSRAIARGSAGVSEREVGRLGECHGVEPALHELSA